MIISEVLPVGYMKLTWLKDVSVFYKKHLKCNLVNFDILDRFLYYM